MTNGTRTTDREQDELAEAPAGESLVRRVLERVGVQNVSLLVALAILVAIIGSQNSSFFLRQNLFNIGASVTIIGLLAVAQTAVMLTSSLDISVGSITGIASVSAALGLAWTGSAFGGIGMAIGAGLLAGLVNAAIIVYGRINPIIATLATLSAFRGIAFLLSDGRAISANDPVFRTIGSGRIGTVPVSIFLLVFFAIAVHVLLRYTDIGRNIYAIGGNPTAARLSDISIKRYLFGVYLLSGLGAGLAGIMLTARTLSGQPSSGSEGLELEAITAAVLGGTAVTGGRGTIAGTFLAVVLLGVLTNGMILLNVPTFYQLVAKGSLLVIAVIIQQRRSGEAQSELLA